MVDRGRATSPAFAGSITVSGGGARSITGAAGSIFDITGLGANVPTDYTKTVSSFGSTLLNFDSNVLVRIGDGAVDFGSGSPTTINGVLQVLLGGSVGQVLSPCYYGTNSILRFANTVDYQIGVNDKTWAAGSIASGNPGIPWNVDVFDNGTDLTMQNTRALRGNLTINNGSFTLTPAFTGSFVIGGNWTRSGATSAFNHNSKEVVFNKQVAGNQQVTVNTGVTTETFYDVDFNPTAGDMVFNGNVNAINTANLISGKVDLNGNVFTLGTTSNDGTLTGGSATEYFVSGTAAAKVIRYTTTPSTTYSFPVGDATDYTPISVSLYGSALATNSQLSVNIIPSAHPNKGTATTYLKRYWQVEPSNFPTPQTGYGVTYQWAAADEAGVIANLKPYKHNAQGWIAAQGSGAIFEMGSATINVGARTFTWSGLYSFSDFTGIGDGTPLPISLLNFDAQPLIEQVQLTWSTATEINNDYFTVERSKDGQDFKPLATVPGAGNSNTILNYKLMDYAPLEGISYYRLKQTDFDGKFSFSDVKAVNFNKANGANVVAAVYPNPSTAQGFYLTTGKVAQSTIQVTLSDLTGKTVHSQQLPVNEAGDNHFIRLPEISAGIYYLSVFDGNTNQTLKLVINK